MKLQFALASPFVRKVRVVAEELGIADRIELVERAVSPISPNDALNSDNPLGKIPALVLDDGEVLYDSRTISEYLDAIGGGGLIPVGHERWQVKRLEALGDGICDALVATRYETFLRPDDKQWPEWIESQHKKAERAFDRLEETFGDWPSELNLGSIAVASALSYSDFRFAERDWRRGRPKLAEWHGVFAARPSMTKTAPE